MAKCTWPPCVWILQDKTHSKITSVLITSIDLASIKPQPHSSLWVVLQRIKSAAEPRGSWDRRRRGTHIPVSSNTYCLVPSHSLLSTIVSFPSVICKSVIIRTILIFSKPRSSQTMNLKSRFYINFGAGNELCLNCILLQDDSFYCQLLQLRERELLRETGKLSQRKVIGKINETLRHSSAQKSYLPVFVFFFFFFLIRTTMKGCKLLLQP